MRVRCRYDCVVHGALTAARLDIHFTCIECISCECSMSSGVIKVEIEDAVGIQILGNGNSVFLKLYDTNLVVNIDYQYKYILE